MTEKRLNRILAVVFLIVGIVAATNTFRLHSYIRETLPRDQAQEQCNTDTIRVLQSWVEERIRRDTALDNRDTISIAALSEWIAGKKADTQDLIRWRDAIAADMQLRDDTTTKRVPLPHCFDR